MDQTSVKQGWWGRFKKRSKARYRLVVMNAETFDEVSAHNLTPLNLYVALTTLLLLLTLGVFALVAFTPLRTYVPGYGDVVQQQELQAIEKEMAKIQRELKIQTEYTENFRRILVGDAISVDELEEPAADTSQEKALAVPTLTAEEIQLRRQVALRQAGEAAANGQGIVKREAPTPGSNAITLEQHNLLAPVTGEIRAGFRPAENHLGIDILAPRNTAVKAAATGVVFMSEYTTANGNVVGILHEGDLVTFYKHNSELLKKVGDNVNRGEAVAIIGNTGTLSTGPHLHFEIWFRGLAIDPATLLNF